MSEIEQVVESTAPMEVQREAEAMGEITPSLRRRAALRLERELRQILPFAPL